MCGDRLLGVSLVFKFAMLLVVYIVVLVLLLIVGFSLLAVWFGYCGYRLSSFLLFGFHG